MIQEPEPRVPGQGPPAQKAHVSLGTGRMDARHLAVQMIFFFQIVLGLLGNLSLLSHHLFVSLTGCRPRATDFIVKNVIVANFLVLMSSGFCYPLTFSGEIPILNDFGCRFCYYARQVGRSMSISTTCLLSVVQAVTISPWRCREAGLRGKPPKCVLPCIALCWGLNLLVNFIYPVFMYSSFSDKNDTSRKRYGQCSAVRHDPASDILYGSLLSFPEVVFFVTMVGASGSMVYTLSRHRQRVRHLPGFASSTSSPESRATHTILLLVSTFICLNIISSMLKMVVSVMYNPDWFLVNMNTVIILSFPTLCPFLLLSQEYKVSLLCSARMRNSKCHKPLRNM
ncbi:vomeronasal type-1 receptor 4-like [Talpa occidentalis]|uniref:vomeronasal type-1 receptor 4-like n=1 Tax=Talpa occidentalis TaxID=50954 RepID=UPI00188ED018|nr:vomeronasal type-1 receptor 4-like [Talpa occidentalis]